MDDFKEYTLYPTNDQPDFRFVGKRLAYVTSERDGRRNWTELTAYQTRGGKWVVEKVGATSNEDQERFVTVLIFDDQETMTAKMGFGHLNERLYRKLGFTEVYID